ncbi:MAG: ATP-binding protein, partial [Bacteroidota bacterium]|nr:ATP-binding protein [Bacteroidota bacterium]
LNIAVMLIQFALIISVLLQFGAFFITISLIQRTKFNISWIMISIGFFLMAIRRLGELICVIDPESNIISLPINSWIAILISVLMFVASIFIRQIFNLQGKINKLRKENEAKVLSAIIKTEEKERQKFAKEIHDGLGPILSSIKMAISAINKSTLSKTNEEIFDKTENSVDNAIISVKEISNKLSPHILERFGLEKAIKTFTDTIVTGKNLKIIHVFNLNEKRFNYNIEVILYRIIGELISNTLKYASASEIEISLFSYEDKLEMFYSDNGIGFDLKKIEKKGLGLSNINSRIKSLDGKIEMHSKPKQGFFLKIVLPL